MGCFASMPAGFHDVTHVHPFSGKPWGGFFNQTDTTTITRPSSWLFIRCDCVQVLFLEFITTSTCCSAASQDSCVHSWQINPPKVQKCGETKRWSQNNEWVCLAFSGWMKESISFPDKVSEDASFLKDTEEIGHMGHILGLSVSRWNHNRNRKPKHLATIQQKHLKSSLYSAEYDRFLAEINLTKGQTAGIKVKPVATTRPGRIYRK